MFYHFCAILVYTFKFISPFFYLSPFFFTLIKHVYANTDWYIINNNADDIQACCSAKKAIIIIIVQLDCYSETYREMISLLVVVKSHLFLALILLHICTDLW